DRGSNTPLLGRARHSARGTVSHPLAWQVRGSVTGLYTGRTAMQRDDIGNVTWRDAYPRLDVRLARPVANAEVTLGVENVLDTRPSNWSGLTERQVTLGLTWTGRF
ncbi:MAG TPA: TonB-dependent receptor, partial [Gemmatimonadaceae bacterium]|nr:TonB-dependent receptor [Gemmatimonadaceae bacterium]